MHYNKDGCYTLMTKFSPAECLEQLTNIDFIARALCAGFGASVAFQMETDTIVVPKSAKTKGGWTKLLCKSIGTSKGTGCLILLISPKAEAIFLQILCV